MKSINCLGISLLLFGCLTGASQVTADEPKPLVVESMDLTPNCKADLNQPIPASGPDEILVTAYNVYNLFDNRHDFDNGEEKNDWEYMPKVEVDANDNYVSGPRVKYDGCQAVRNRSMTNCSNEPQDRQEDCRGRTQYYYEKCISANWTEDVLDKKYETLVEAFDHFMEGQARPDIVMLSEVENANVVGELGRRLGYFSNKSVGKTNVQANKNDVIQGRRGCTYRGIDGLQMTTSPDNRGIDVAIIFNPNNPKFRFVSCNEYNAQSGGDRDTRNLLEVEFKVDGKDQLFVYANHWPSQAGPTELRVNVANTLKGLIANRLRQNPRARIVATGDFNVVPEDMNPSRPFEDNLVSGQPPMNDVWSMLRNQGDNTQGTYYYPPKLAWNDLDRFFLSDNLINARSGLHAKMDSFVVHNHEPLVRNRKIRLHRDMAVVERLRNEGQNIRYPNLYTDFSNQLVQDKFTANPDLEALDINEPCAPNRFSSNSASGYSDHFAVSMRFGF